MKLLIPFFTILFVSCAPQQLAYKFQLNQPAPSKSLYYENDSMSIDFAFNPTELQFTLNNKMNDGLKINWDEVSLSLDGKAKRIIHKETGMSKTTDLQPPTTIPPKSSLSDIIVPSDNVSFIKVYRNYTAQFRPMFPNEVKRKYVDRYLSRKGEKIVLFMPLRIADQYVTQTFYFTIIDIYKINRSKGKKLTWK